MTRTVNPKGIALVKSFEGLSLKSYPDPATGGAPYTIGYGTTGPDIKPGMQWTKEQCEARFARDLAVFARKVDVLIGDKPTTANQFAAMVSLAYNIGLGNFGGSTLLKLHKAGSFDLAQQQFTRWNRANGKIMDGLTRRRQAEAALYGEAA